MILASCFTQSWPNISLLPQAFELGRTYVLVTGLPARRFGRTYVLVTGLPTRRFGRTYVLADGLLGVQSDWAVG
jgi:hypothetical protein